MNAKVKWLHSSFAFVFLVAPTAMRRHSCSLRVSWICVTSREMVDTARASHPSHFVYTINNTFHSIIIIFSYTRKDCLFFRADVMRHTSQATCDLISEWETFASVWSSHLIAMDLWMFVSPAVSDPDRVSRARARLFINNVLIAF